MNTAVQSLILLLLVVRMVTAGFFSSSIDKLKKKAKDAFKNKVKKGLTTIKKHLKQTNLTGVSTRSDPELMGL